MMTDHAGLLARYKHLRKVGLELNNKLVKRLTGDVFDEGVRALGLTGDGKTLMLDTEDEMAVLADYCLHDVRRGGLNTIDRFLTESPPPAGSDEMLMLQAKQQAWFTLIQVTDLEPGVGVHVHDLLRDEPQFIVDIGFSNTADPGMILAARLMIVDGIGMTTGAALPVSELTQQDRERLFKMMGTVIGDADPRNLPPEVASTLAGRIIRGLLKRGAAEYIGYCSPSAHARRRHTPAPAAKQHAGRNDPCPCGSGRKFKHCCGRHH